MWSKLSQNTFFKEGLKMNRQQFITELSQYLTFYSPEEKAGIISAFNERFDSVGPEGEAALMLELGTPMMTAINLKRRMEAGMKSAFGEEPLFREKAVDLSEYSVETETMETLDAENEEASIESSEEEEATGDIPEAEPEKTPEKSNPVTAKLVFALLGASFLSIIIAAVFLAVAAVGVGFLVSMCYLLITGLQNLLYVSDALLLFGGGLICAGLGIVIVWFAVWSALSLISKLYRSACRAGLPASDKE